jgi:hypothetical protein
MAGGKLRLDDIVDLRAYEREREEFRTRIIALKKRRRVSVGPVITLLFENRDTIRFQIQEMARAEKMMSDEQIQTELDVYNPLIPEPGHLSATLFLELTSDAELREYLPKLVGIERAIEIHVGDTVVACEPEPSHEEQLTREDITASVHYIFFTVPDAVIDRFASDEVSVVVNHPAYQERTVLSDETKQSLLEDLRGA